ncbi:MAG: hypothetical protein QF824_02500 [Candidatus Woesearchaeota archaeon]|jgi:hypothetical protein|nr:hypothetical protein [Candidatus Woesearchaeota archaeon]
MRDTPERDSSIFVYVTQSTDNGSLCARLKPTREKFEADLDQGTRLGYLTLEVFEVPQDESGIAFSHCDAYARGRIDTAELEERMSGYTIPPT